MEQKTRFRRLIESAKIGGMAVKNRMIMAPMGTALSTGPGLVTDEMEIYYETRAKGGVGLIIVENACIDFPRGKQRAHALSIDGEETIPGLARLAQVIKKHGARVAIQLHHSGRVARSGITGFQPVGPSSIASVGGELPQELTIGEIHTLVARFAKAALLAKNVGFDAVEIHAAHHYLLAQFLSPASNRRIDEYGGSLANRARIVLEVIREVRRTVGQDFPVWCRINAKEFGMDNGLSLEDALDIVGLINETPIDAISVSAFGYGKFESTIKPETPGALIPLAAEVKKVAHKPVMAAGMITPEVGEQALARGQIDLVVIGRALIADPDLPNKVISGLEEEIRPCIGCYVCDDSRATGGSIRCSVNAAAGRESHCAILPLQKVRNVWVIGSGPAGMEAARTAAKRGCEVSLFERDKAVGGQLLLASVPPHKEKIQNLTHYYLTQLSKLGVKIELGREVTPERVKNAGVDVVVIATGIRTAIPDLPGFEGQNFFLAQEVLSGQAVVGNHVLVIGGGMVGCETADFLEERGKRVTLVEMLPELATNMRPTPRRKLLERLGSKPINIFTEAKCERMTDRGLVIIDKHGEKITVEADTLVFATGGISNDKLYQSLGGVIPKLFQAGDCVQPRGIMEAIDEGMQIALRIS